MLYTYIWYDFGESRFLLFPIFKPNISIIGKISILTRGFLHQYLPEGFYRNIIVRTKLDNYMCITFTGLAYFLWKNKPSP